MIVSTAAAVLVAFATADRATTLDPFGPAVVAGTNGFDTTLRLKAALAADPQLKGLPLLVSVADGVAVIGGAVPSADAIRQIERIAAASPGITAVRTACWVDVGEDPLRRLVADRLKANVAPPVVPVQPYTPPAVATPDPRPTAMVVVQKPTTPALMNLLLDPGRPQTSARGANDDAPAVWVPPPPPGPAQFPTIPPTAVPVEPDVAADVAAVRRADRRFTGLTTTVRGGVVTITGVADDGDAWDLAEAVRVLPGVKRVVVGRIDVR